jgi:hypothetical protein
MFNTTEIEYLRRLYQKIFRQNANKSKEFINFVAGSPHGLRAKIDDTLININDAILYLFSENGIVDHIELRRLVNKRDLLKELDVFIINYIENDSTQN